jgi:shikimate kinase
MKVNKKIFLIGMMGSGKSTIGAALAARLALPFLDTDVVIEKMEGKSIQQIFEQEGEAYFRVLEERFIQHLTNEAAVVACGGGLPCFFNNMELLCAKGSVVYLKAAPALLYQRINGDGRRPKLQDLESFTRLNSEREETYQKAHIIMNAAQPKDQIVAQLLSLHETISNQ